MDSLSKDEILRAVIDAAPVAIAGLDLDGNVHTVWNKCAESMLGWTAEEVMGHHLPSVDAQNEAEFASFRERIRQGLTMDGVEVRRSRKDGTSIDYSIYAAPVYNANGKVAGNIAVMLDITERKKTEEVLKQNEARFRMLYETTPAMMHSIDDQGRIVHVSDKWLEILGYSRDEVIGHKSTEFLTEESRQFAAETILPDFFRTGYCADVPYQFIAKDGRILDILLSATAERNSDGNIINSFAILQDITEKKKTEKALADERRHLKRTNAELQRRNEELDNFTFIASHDLQEPLRKLSSFSSLLVRDAGDDLNENAKQDLDFIVDSAKRMQDLIQSLLALSRSTRKEMDIHEISLADCVDRALENLGFTQENEDIQIRIDTLPSVKGDKRLLTQLLQNLIGNAAKFNVRKPACIHITLEESDSGQYIFGVKDNGIGIGQKYMDMIFQPFKRLHGRQEFHGTGMGLTIVQKIIERHNGKIWVESVPEKGSHFKFTLGS